MEHEAIVQSPFWSHVLTCLFYSLPAILRKEVILTHPLVPKQVRYESNSEHQFISCQCDRKHREDLKCPRYMPALSASETAVAFQKFP